MRRVDKQQQQQSQQEAAPTHHLPLSLPSMVVRCDADRRRGVKQVMLRIEDCKTSEKKTTSEVNRQADLARRAPTARVRTSINFIADYPKWALPSLLSTGQQHHINITSAQHQHNINTEQGPVRRRAVRGRKSSIRVLSLRDECGARFDSNHERGAWEADQPLQQQDIRQRLTPIS